MTRLIVFLLIACLSWRLVVALDDSDTEEHWEAFKERYDKTYDNPEDEDKARDNFESNLLHVALHNMKDEHDYDKDVNEHSDMSPKEMIKAMCRTEVPDDIDTREFVDYSISERSVPSAVDWNKAGKVTSVKQQGGCGSCWTFSAAQAIESAYAIKYNNLVDLSEQQLVDCAGDYGNNGCQGGWPQNAFEYVMHEGGIATDKCYPYAEEDDECHIQNDCKRYKISGYKNVGPSGNEDAVRNALAQYGPLTTAVYVSDNFMHYSGNGVFKDPSYKGQSVNHGVLLTGYGTEEGQDYWIIKNSWGTSWGEDGYMKLARNYGNHLKVASYTSYPTV